LIAQRTQVGHCSMSVLCQQETHALHQKSMKFSTEAEMLVCM
jgi:hypothetical protein